ncbi:MAG: nucleoside-diphosphate sugar epimerase/dehydratase [Eubacteriales bacterium]|nr:nucleoside-diphosphate sugar epimerase/dehydratase [Eubacteriales bacterium]
MIRGLIKKNPMVLVLQMFMDLILIDISLLLSKVLFYHFVEKSPNDMITITDHVFELVIFSIVFVVVYAAFGIYNSVLRYISTFDIIKLLIATFVGTLASAMVASIPALKIAIHFDILLFFFFILSFKCAIYIIYRYAYEKIKRINCDGESRKRIMVIGAGDAGALVVKEYLNNRSIDGQPIVFIDDNVALHGRTIYNIPVVGGREAIVSSAEKYKINEIILAIPSAPKIESQKILNICAETNCKLKIMPDFGAVFAKDAKKNIREVKIDDLLGREEIEINEQDDFKYIKNAVVMVTGGGGSIGSELCRQIAVAGPKKLIILDFYENNAYDIQQELIRKYGDALDLSVAIVSVQDAVALEKEFRRFRPEIVFHAAAHKHVPLMEGYPEAAIKNNVFGTYNTARFASKYNAKKFILISTDKAVNPTNVMGATKRLAEMVVQEFNKISDTKFAAVRFGNVLGSNGSVIPLFKKQIENGGPVTITDNRITRFFMTINEASQLVILAGSLTDGGEVFVLDMGTPVKIVDLAKNMILLSGLKPYVDINIVEVGLRPGEKLYEELMLEEEGIASTMYKKIFVANPAQPTFKDLDADLDRIRAVVDNSDFDGKQLLLSLVPTYKGKPTIK